MKDIYVTVYTKQHGKQQFTRNQWNSYDENIVDYHRLDGPAIEVIDGDKSWYVDGKLHRTGGPAEEYANGYKEWCINGKPHRTDGPAIEYANGYKEWYINGKLHRLDGPAYNWGDGYKEWYIDNIEYTEEKHKELIQKYKQLPKSIKMSHELWWVREL